MISAETLAGPRVGILSSTATFRPETTCQSIRRGSSSPEISEIVGARAETGAEHALIGNPGGRFDLAQFSRWPARWAPRYPKRSTGRFCARNRNQSPDRVQLAETPPENLKSVDPRDTEPVFGCSQQKGM